MKKHRLIIFCFIVIIAGVLAWTLMFKQKIQPNAILVSGNIEVTDARLGFKIAGRLEQCFADEGDSISKGDLMARLEDHDQKILMDLARANLDRARSVLLELTAGSLPDEIVLAHAKVLQARQMVLELTRGSRDQEIKSSVSDLETAMAEAKSAQTQLIQARKDHDRFSTLYTNKSATQRDFELYRTRYEVARNSFAQASSRVEIARQNLSLRREGPRKEQIQQAKAVLVQAEAEYALVKSGPRKEKIDQAKALVDEAEQKLNQAKQQLAYTKLLAPMDGVVLTRSAEPGEYLNLSAPVVTLADIARPWLRAFINEKDLGRIRLGDKAVVTIDSFPDKKYQGVLSFISSQAEFTPKSVQTFEERVKLMFRIKISLSNPNGDLKPGMPADASISISVQ